MPQASNGPCLGKIIHLCVKIALCSGQSQLMSEWYLYRKIHIGKTLPLLGPLRVTVKKWPVDIQTLLQNCFYCRC